MQNKLDKKKQMLPNVEMKFESIKEKENLKAIIDNNDSVLSLNRY